MSQPSDVARYLTPSAVVWGTRPQTEKRICSAVSEIRIDASRTSVVVPTCSPWVRLWVAWHGACRASNNLEYAVSD